MHQMVESILTSVDSGLQWIRLPEGVVYVGRGDSPIRRSIEVPEGESYDWLRDIKSHNQAVSLRERIASVERGTIRLLRLLAEGERALQQPLYDAA